MAQSFQEIATLARKSAVTAFSPQWMEVVLKELCEAGEALETRVKALEDAAEKSKTS